MISEAEIPIAVKFPLSGEWCAVNTPGEKVPSHGTDQLGQRYAYDFLQIDWSKGGFKFYKTPTLGSLIFGVNLTDTYCWSQTIYSPFDGEVVEAGDGVKERNPIHVIRDLFLVIKNGFTFRATNNSELSPLLGNFIILRNDNDVYALVAHARTGSVKVKAGDRVKEGQELAQVGHSGNSTAPHLHFQLMDRPELLEAKGLPCCFKSYQTHVDGEWLPVVNGIPGRRERIRA